MTVALRTSETLLLKQHLLLLGSHSTMLECWDWSAGWLGQGTAPPLELVVFSAGPLMFCILFAALYRGHLCPFLPSWDRGLLEMQVVRCQGSRVCFCVWVLRVYGLFGVFIKMWWEGEIWNHNTVSGEFWWVSYLLGFILAFQMNDAFKLVESWGCFSLADSENRYLCRWEWYVHAIIHHCLTPDVKHFTVPSA